MDSKEKDPFRSEESWIGTENPVENELHEDTGVSFRAGSLRYCLSVRRLHFFSLAFLSLELFSSRLFLLCSVCALKIRQEIRGIGRLGGSYIGPTRRNLNI